MRSEFSIITSFRFSLLSKSWPLRAVIATGVLLLAACGQAHFQVTKKQTADQTRSAVRRRRPTMSPSITAE